MSKNKNAALHTNSCSITANAVCHINSCFKYISTFHSEKEFKRGKSKIKLKN